MSEALSRESEVFLGYLEGERGASPHTLKSYRTDLVQFEAFVRSRRLGPLPPTDARAIRELLYATGLRVGEAAALDVPDVDFGSGVVLVRGKGNKERLVPVGDQALR